MTHAIPVPLPSALVDHHELDLERTYTDGWGVKVNDVTTAPTGEMYAGGSNCGGIEVGHGSATLPTSETGWKYWETAS